MRIGWTCLICLLWTSFLSAQGADEDKTRIAIDKGFAWLARQQDKDGSWSDKGQFRTATTALAGMALLADGHTFTEGKYADNIRRAYHYYAGIRVNNGLYNGVLGDPESPDSTGRYMMEHGMALSFLSKLYCEDVGKERAAFRDRLNAAVAFSVKGQSSLGGWFYSSTVEGHDSTENVATAIQLQGLLDAREAGIAVPRQSTKRAHDYLQACTSIQGGIVYSFTPKGDARPVAGGRPIITAMALAAYLPTDDSKLSGTKPWVAFLAESPHVLPEKLAKTPDLLPHLYLSKAVYHLKDEQWINAFPKAKRPDHLIWIKYRKALFEHLVATQEKDGSWSGQAWGPGPVFNTCLALNILLVEKSAYIPLSR